jgi:hypothetical protein
MFNDMKHEGKFKVFCAGMAKAFDFGNSISVHRRSRTFKRMDGIVKMYGNEMSDREQLANDWFTVGNDMRLAIDKYGEMNGGK